MMTDGIPRRRFLGWSAALVPATGLWGGGGAAAHTRPLTPDQRLLRDLQARVPRQAGPVVFSLIRPLKATAAPHGLEARIAMDWSPGRRVFRVEGAGATAEEAYRRLRRQAVGHLHAAMSA